MMAARSSPARPRRRFSAALGPMVKQLVIATGGLLETADRKLRGNRKIAADLLRALAGFLVGMERPEEERFSREAFVRVDCAFGHRSTLPHAASRTVPVRAVVLTCAERFDHFRKRATHASPISLSMPGRPRVQTIASLMTMLRNKAPSASETPRRITSPAMARLRVSRSAI